MSADEVIKAFRALSSRDQEFVRKRIRRSRGRPPLIAEKLEALAMYRALPVDMGEIEKLRAIGREFPKIAPTTLEAVIRGADWRVNAASRK
jgi:hypothetical protein